MSKFSVSRYNRKITDVLMGVYMIIDGLVSIFTLGRINSHFGADYSYKRLRKAMDDRKSQAHAWAQKVAEFKRKKADEDIRSRTDAGGE